MSSRNDGAMAMVMKRLLFRRSLYTIKLSASTAGFHDFRRHIRGIAIAALAAHEGGSMSKQNKIARLTSPPTQNARGRTARITGDETDIGGKDGAVKHVKRTEVNQP